MPDKWFIIEPSWKRYSGEVPFRPRIGNRSASKCRDSLLRAYAQCVEPAAHTAVFCNFSLHRSSKPSCRENWPIAFGRIVQMVNSLFVRDLGAISSIVNTRPDACLTHDGYEHVTHWSSSRDFSRDCSSIRTKYGCLTSNGLSSTSTILSSTHSLVIFI